MSTSEATPLCPYVGLAPFRPEHAPYFCGRETETEVLVANASVSSVTILYGPSGCGKSSLLGAGLIPRIHAAPQEAGASDALPAHPVVVMARDWSNDPLKSLERAIKRALKPWPECESLEWPQAWFARHPSAPQLILAMDQVEELFVQHPELAEASAAQIIRTADAYAKGTAMPEPSSAALRWAGLLTAFIRDPRCGVNTVLSLREDCLADLDVIKAALPRLFDTMIRVDSLDEAATERAIREPLLRFNQLVAPQQPLEVEDELVRALLADEDLRLDPPSAQRSSASTVTRYATPFLQLALERLWKDDIDTAKGAKLNLTTFKNHGFAAGIRRQHVNGALEAAFKDRPDYRQVFARASTELVTRTQKISWLASELAEKLNKSRGPDPANPEVQQVKVEPAELAAFFRSLEQPTRIMREMFFPDAQLLPDTASAKNERDGLFQIAHDRLIADILAWRENYDKDEAVKAAAVKARLDAQQDWIDQQKRLGDEKESARRRLKYGGIGAAIALLVVGILAVVFYNANLASQVQTQALKGKVDELDDTIKESTEQRTLTQSSIFQIVQQETPASASLSAAPTTVLASPEATSKLDSTSAQLVAQVAAQAADTERLQAELDKLASVRLQQELLTAQQRVDDAYQWLFFKSSDAELARRITKSLEASKASIESIKLPAGEGGDQEDAKRQALEKEREARLGFIVSAIKSLEQKLAPVLTAAPVTDEALAVLPHGDQVWSVQFAPQTIVNLGSPSGSPVKGQLLTAGSDGKVRLWTPDGKAPGGVSDPVLFFAKEGFSMATFNRDGTKIAAAGNDSSVYRFDVKAWRMLPSYTYHTDVVTCVAISPSLEKPRLASTSADRRCRGVSWDSNFTKLKGGQYGVMTWCAFDNIPDEKLSIIVSCDDGILRLYDYDDHYIRWQHPCGAPIRRASFSPRDGLVIAAAGTRAFIISANGPDKGSTSIAPQPLSPGLQTPVWFASFRPRPADGSVNTTGGEAETFVLCCGDGSARLGTVNDASSALAAQETGKLVQADGKPLHTAPIRDAAWWRPTDLTNKTTLLALASEDGTASVWNVTDPAAPKLVRHLRGHQGRIWRIAWNEEGTRIATASEDKTARLWKFDPGGP